MRLVLLGAVLAVVPPLAVAVFVALDPTPVEEGSVSHPASRPPVEVSDGGDVHLGQVPLGEAVTWFFEIANTGDGLISFGEPETDCTCLEAQIGDRSLGPGESTHVRMVHSPTGVGESVSTATVLVNTSTGSSILPLRVRTLGTEVPERLRLVPEIVDLGDVRTQTSAHFALRLQEGTCATRCADLEFDPGDSLTVQCEPGEERAVTLRYEGLGDLPYGAFSIPIRARCRDDPEEADEVVLVGRKLPEDAEGWPSCFVLLTEGRRSSESLRFPDVTIHGVKITGSGKISASVVPADRRDTVELVLEAPPGLVDVAIASLDTSVGEVRVRVIASDTEERLEE